MHCKRVPFEICVHAGRPAVKLLHFSSSLHHLLLNDKRMLDVRVSGSMKMFQRFQNLGRNRKSWGPLGYTPIVPGRARFNCSKLVAPRCKLVAPCYWDSNHAISFPVLFYRNWASIEALVNLSAWRLLSTLWTDRFSTAVVVCCHNWIQLQHDVPQVWHQGRRKVCHCSYWNWHAWCFLAREELQH